MYKDINVWKSVYKIRFQPTSLADSRFYYIDGRTGEFVSGGSNTVYAGTNMAKVFEDNPARTPDLKEVELPWIDDSAKGFLTSIKHSNGSPMIVAANCPNNGEKISYPQYGDVPICSPTQIANKETNGSFIYEDYQDALASKFNATDVFPEVAAYYHVSKMYKYLADLNVGFKELQSPIIVTANFQMVEGSMTLRPMDNAFFTPNTVGFNDLFFKNFPYQGDIIAMGQGSRIDTAVDGDVVYHEFGHALVNSTSALTMLPIPDKYGYHIMPQSLNEGIADTFSFIVSNDSCLAEFFGDAAGGMSYEPLPKDGEFTCLRTSNNPNLVNENFVGESHHDGLPVSGANWEIYNLAIKNNISKDDFAKLFLKVVMSLTTKSTYINYAKTFMSEVDKNTLFAPMKSDIEKILTDRHFFDEIRAADLNTTNAIFSGGTEAYGYPKSYYEIEVDKVVTKLAPAYIQLYFDLPADKNKITISAQYVISNSQLSGNPSYSVFMRKGAPVEYDKSDFPVMVKHDQYVNGSKSWSFSNLESGQRYYFSFVDSGVQGVIAMFKTTTALDGEIPNQDSDIIVEDNDVVVNDSGETDKEIVVTDNDSSETDSELVVTDKDSAADVDKSSKKDSGCSILAI